MLNSKVKTDVSISLKFCFIDSGKTSIWHENANPYYCQSLPLFRSRAKFFDQRWSGAYEYIVKIRLLVTLINFTSSAWRNLHDLKRFCDTGTSTECRGTPNRWIIVILCWVTVSLCWLSMWFYFLTLPVEAKRNLGCECSWVINADMIDVTKSFLVNWLWCNYWLCNTFSSCWMHGL